MSSDTALGAFCGFVGGLLFVALIMAFYTSGVIDGRHEAHMECIAKSGGEK